MPNVRKLSHDEVRTIERKTLGLRRAIEAEYNTFIRDFAPGDYGEATLEPSEKRLTVRSRLKAAAARQEPPLQLTFHRTREKDVVRFRVSEAAEKVTPAPVSAAKPATKRASRAVATDTPPTPRKPGRPRKNSVVEAAPSTTSRRTGRAKTV